MMTELEAWNTILDRMLYNTQTDTYDRVMFQNPESGLEWSDGLCDFVTSMFHWEKTISEEVRQTMGKRIESKRPKHMYRSNDFFWPQDKVGRLERIKAVQEFIETLQKENAENLSSPVATSM